MKTDLILADYLAARAQLRDMRFSVLHPVYPSLGCGKLRVLRVRQEADGPCEVLAGYESYERIEQ
ncbi:MAG: hypothetical protein DLM50_09380 [Candidatus Meridianibacter frigidus]|nr:MAG: hypothetical protein DLM50_09380 [Candidatus Eremiobacteraeota bacterium]